MASPTAGQILSELAPAKSKSRYDQAWAEFMAFLNCDDHQPNEEDYIQYFHHLQSGYCKAVMGRNYLSDTGKLLATALKLKDPESYTGHCFRCTSATAAANTGANTMELKHHFGWQQESTALKYTKATKTRAVKMAKLLVGDDTAAKSSEVTPSPDANNNNKQHGESTSMQDGESTLMQRNTQFYNIDLRNASNISISVS